MGGGGGGGTSQWYNGHRLTDTHQGRLTVRTSPVNLLPARAQLVMLSGGVWWWWLHITTNDGQL